MAALLVVALAVPEVASAVRPRVSWLPTTGYAEGERGIMLASQLSVRDSDSRRLMRARIRLRGGPEPGERLTFVGSSASAAPTTPAPGC